MANIIIGQVLLTTTNEKVTIVEIKDSSITVSYRGKDYIRDKTIIGEKLFLTEEDKKKYEEKYEDEIRSLEVFLGEERRSQKQDQYRRKGVRQGWPTEMRGPY